MTENNKSSLELFKEFQKLITKKESQTELFRATGDQKYLYRAAKYNTDALFIAEDLVRILAKIESGIVV